MSLYNKHLTYSKPQRHLTDKNLWIFSRRNAVDKHLLSLSQFLVADCVIGFNSSI